MSDASPYLEAASESRSCRECGTAVSPGLLACPGCSQLIHADELSELAANAAAAREAGDLRESLSLWRRALELLPSDTRQFTTIAGYIDELGREVDAGGEKPQPEDGKPESGIAGKTAGVGVAGLLLWKFKFIVVLVFSKLKILLLGLTKAKTMLTMFLSLGVYWTAWGWKFALGVIVSIYVHEMGHVSALKRYGIRASAPTFIPGFGALVRLKQMPTNPRENARIGLSGPAWGLITAMLCYLAFLVTGWPLLGAIAKVGAWINLFNLLPIPPLDGGRGFHALPRFQKWIAVAAIAVMWYFTAEGLLVLLLLVAVLGALVKSSVTEADWRGTVEYVTLVVALSVLSAITITTGTL